MSNPRIHYPAETCGCLLADGTRTCRRGATTKVGKRMVCGNHAIQIKKGKR